MIVLVLWNDEMGGEIPINYQYYKSDNPENCVKYKSQSPPPSLQKKKKKTKKKMFQIFKN